MIQQQTIYVPVDEKKLPTIDKFYHCSGTKNTLESFFVEEQENKIVLDLKEFREFIEDAYTAGYIAHSDNYQCQNVTYTDNLIKHL